MKASVYAIQILVDLHKHDFRDSRKTLKARRVFYCSSLFENILANLIMRVIAINTDSKKNIILDVDPDDKVIKVKQRTNPTDRRLSLDRQRLSLEDKQLDDGLRIKDYEIKEDSIIQLKTTISDQEHCRSLRSNITERGNEKWIGEMK